MSNFGSLLAITSGEVQKIANPIIELLNAVLPAMIAVVAAIGAIWCIVLGVKYAKADDPQEHEKAKKGLKNAIIGFVLIFVLLIAIRVGVVIFEKWYINYEVPTLD